MRAGMGLAAEKRPVKSPHTIRRGAPPKKGVDGVWRLKRRADATLVVIPAPRSSCFCRLALRPRVAAGCDEGAQLLDCPPEQLGSHEGEGTRFPDIVRHRLGPRGLPLRSKVEQASGTTLVPNSNTRGYGSSRPSRSSPGLLFRPGVQHGASSPHASFPHRSRWPAGHHRAFLGWVGPVCEGRDPYRHQGKFSSPGKSYRAVATSRPP